MRAPLRLVNTFCLAFGIKAEAAAFFRGGGGFIGAAIFTGAAGLIGAAGFGGKAAIPRGMGSFEAEGTGFGGSEAPESGVGSIAGGIGLSARAGSSTCRVDIGVDTTRAL